ncbi:MAG TPA: MFS transporter [Rectinemataceae bacterium]|nr:MFS transporter [Rectinemataceae bacterium]
MIDISRTFNFALGQPKNWRVTAARASIDKLIYQMVFPYLGVYIVGLGASGTTLGLANGLGMAISALYGLLGASILRKSGTKKMYLGGLALVAFSYLILGVSGGWLMGMAGLMAWWLGSTEAGLCCNVVCGSSLENKVRATAMGSCESVAQGTMSFIGPAVGAGLLGLLGGMSVGAIRPLFFIAFAGELGCLYFVQRNLEECVALASATGIGEGAVASAAAGVDRKLPTVASNPFRILKGRKHLGKFIAVSCLTSLPTGMVLPFSQLFASEAKSASPYILGAMVTGSALVSIIAGLPIGRLADKVGRKKILYALAPFFLASNLLLVFSSTPALLILSGILQGVFPVTLVISAAMSFEQVPTREMGDWMALQRFFKMAMGAVLTIIAGLIWDHLGGKWVFLLAAGIDILVRIPLLMSIPETLEKKA